MASSYLVCLHIILITCKNFMRKKTIQNFIFKKIPIFKARVDSFNFVTKQFMKLIVLHNSIRGM